jgi:CheY-like chemotaxis protein
MTDSQHTILIVEDDVDIRDAMSALLESRGYAVSVARHGAEALEQLKAGSRPCIILLDLMMPVMDGWTFCQETERDPALAGIPILIVSAVTRLDSKTASVRSVAQLSKPLNFDDLLATLAVHC